MEFLSRVYDDFEPSTEWASEDGFDTLLVFLPGFKREEIKVQITSARNLRIMGERQVGENHWSRFRKEFPISSNHDSHRISARFDSGILYVKHPKMIVPAEPLAVEEQQRKPKPAAETQTPPVVAVPKAEQQRTTRPDQEKETKESPKSSESKSKPELQYPRKTGSRRETAEPPKPLDHKSEPQDAQLKELEKIRGKSKTREEHSSKETGHIGESRVPKDGVDALTGASPRIRQAEEEKAVDTPSEKLQPMESVHGDDGNTRKETVRSLSARKSASRKLEERRKNTRDILAKMSKIRNIVNWVVAGLIVLALALYVKHIIISRGTIQPGIGQED